MRFSALFLGVLFLFIFQTDAQSGQIGECLPTDCCDKGDCVPARTDDLTYLPEKDAWYDRVTKNMLYSSQKNVRELDCLPQTYVCRSPRRTTTYCILKASRF